MLVPLIWQNDYVKIDKDIKTITDRLSETGSHVEEVTIRTSDLKGVVVGHVLEQEKHPNADRLKVLKIDIGKVNKSPPRIPISAAGILYKMQDYSHFHAFFLTNLNK